MKVAWTYLLVAGVAEWGWPVGLKLGWSEAGVHWHWIALAIVFMAVSGWLLLLAQRMIPMGTAYAVWTGIGAVGTFVIGILAFGDAATVPRIACVALIVTGIVGMKVVTK